MLSAAAPAAGEEDRKALKKGPWRARGRARVWKMKK
jgi:hypothetical protein